jgi:glycosyltransferase involved in cell wall biosynthesis
MNPRTSNHSISVIIPVYNEEGNIRNTLHAALAAFPEICPDFEIVVVESGSTDNSLRIVREEAEKNKNIIVLHQERKEGMGSALREGYRHCTKEWVCHLEADRPFDFRDIANASQYFDRYDFIRGYRTGEDGYSTTWLYSKRTTWLRKFVRLAFHHGYNFFVYRLFNVDIHDVNFSFKLTRRSLIKKLDLRTNGWFIDTELVLELKKAQARFKEIPIRYCMRENGRSTVTPVSPFPIMKDALKYRFTRWKKTIITGNSK